MSHGFLTCLNKCSDLGHPLETDSRTHGAEMRPQIARKLDLFWEVEGEIAVCKIARDIRVPVASRIGAKVAEVAIVTTPVFQITGGVG